MFKGVPTAITILLTVLLACAPAFAAPGDSTVDQEQTSTGSGVGFDALYPAAQGFTAGRTGPMDRVSVPVTLLISRAAGDLEVEVKRADAEGLPTGAVLGTGSLPAESFTVGAPAAWRDVTLAQPVRVEQDERYVVILSSEHHPTDGAFYNWRASLGDPYAGGNALWINPGSGEWEVRHDNGVPMDFAFKTFVADIGAPTVSSTSPAVKERGVPRDAVVEATFSEAMNPATLTTRTVTLQDVATGRRVPAVVSCNDPCTRVTLDPFGDEAGRLGKNTKYRVTISSSATDVAGNALDTKPDRAGDQAKVWTFTTGQQR
jgi:hypothetical protein